MFTVSVETRFRASHQLARADGSKERPHRHQWSATAHVTSETLDNRGVVMDFQQLKATLDNIVAELDKTTLSKIDYFQRNKPSAENVAKYVYEKLEPELPKGLRLRSIKVVEKPGCSARFAKFG
jgi:6-pyruvoyltetrahydropterin/6-carboxytetrahydropterin synthase